MIRKTLVAAFGIIGSLALEAGATEYVLPVSQDVAPYSYVPSLPRYNSETLYAFVAYDEQETAHAFETYLRFPDLSGVIAPGEVVVAAELLVYYAFDFTGFGDTSDLPGDLHCHEITGPWNQTTLTWNNRPPIAATPTDSVLGIMGFGLQSCDVTATVQTWTTGQHTDNGLAVISPTPRVIGMYSSEAGVAAFLKPTLVVDTTPASEVPALSPLGLSVLAASILGFGGAAARRRVR